MRKLYSLIVVFLLAALSFAQHVDIPSNRVDSIQAQLSLIAQGSNNLFPAKPVLNQDYWLNPDQVLFLKFTSVKGSGQTRYASYQYIDGVWQLLASGIFDAKGLRSSATYHDHKERWETWRRDDGVYLSQCFPVSQSASGYEPVTSTDFISMWPFDLKIAPHP